MEAAAAVEFILINIMLFLNTINASTFLTPEVLLVINIFLEFTKHPLVLLGIVGYALKILTDNRIRNFQFSDRKIECIELSAKALNKVFPLLFDFVRNTDIKDADINKLGDAITLLFEEIMSLRVKSKIYLGNYEYSLQYTNICWRIHDIFQILKGLNRKGHKYNSPENNKIIDEVNKIKKFIIELDSSWPFDMSKFTDRNDNIEDENCLLIYKFTNMLWARALDSQATALRRAEIS